MISSLARKAASLLELMVVVSVIGMLLGLLLPAVQHVRTAAVRVQCLNIMRQVGLAMHSFHDRHGWLPPSVSARSPEGCLSWMVHVLPDVEQETLYRESVAASKVSFDPWAIPPHFGVVEVVGPFRCPADSRLGEPLVDSRGRRAAFASYLGVGGAALRGNDNSSGRWMPGPMPSGRLSEITDGLSTTLLVGERPPPDSLEAGAWYPGFPRDGVGGGPNGIIDLAGIAPFAPDNDCPLSRLVYFGPGRIDNPCDRFHLWSLHPGGANFLFADGSVRFMKYSVQPLIPALASRAGNEVIELP